MQDCLRKIKTTIQLTILPGVTQASLPLPQIVAAAVVAVVAAVELVVAAAVVVVVVGAGMPAAAVAVGDTDSLFHSMEHTPLVDTVPVGTVQRVLHSDSMDKQYSGYFLESGNTGLSSLSVAVALAAVTVAEELTHTELVEPWLSAQ